MSNDQKTTSPIAELSDDRVREMLALALPDTRCDCMSALSLKFLSRPNSKLAAALAADLASPVFAFASGPLTFPRLAGISVEVCQELKGQSFLSALLSRDASRPAMEGLVRFANILIGEELPTLTRLSGCLIRAVARFVLRQRWNASIPDDELEVIRTIIEWTAAAGAPDELVQFVKGCSWNRST